MWKRRRRNERRARRMERAVQWNLYMRPVAQIADSLARIADSVARIVRGGR